MKLEDVKEFAEKFKKHCDEYYGYDLCGDCEFKLICRDMQKVERVIDIAIMEKNKTKNKS